MITAQAALERLREGNQRFASNAWRLDTRTSQARRDELTTGQEPFAVILGCSDSRVPVEIVFDQGLGDLFVIRVAGNVLDDVILGTIEYAVEHMHTPLVMVLGHDKCGAVTATVQDAALPNHIQSLAEALRPAVEAARTQSGDLISNAIDANVQRAVTALRAGEPVLAQACSAGHIQIVGARYNLDTGEVKIIA